MPMEMNRVGYRGFAADVEIDPWREVVAGGVDVALRGGVTGSGEDLWGKDGGVVEIERERGVVDGPLETAGRVTVDVGV